jgi:uncharacterized protein YndB with AHSA1/START domain
MQRTISITREYAHSIDRIWFALTDSDALAAWLMPNTFQPVLGRSFTFQAPAQFGFDGKVQCRVVELDAPRVLAYSWQGGPMKHPTTVRWTLEALGGERTRLTLEHSGFEGLSGLIVRAILSGGWKGLLHEKLADFLKSSSKL